MKEHKCKDYLFKDTTKIDDKSSKKSYQRFKIVIFTTRGEKWKLFYSFRVATGSKFMVISAETATFVTSEFNLCMHIRLYDMSTNLNSIINYSLYSDWNTSNSDDINKLKI